jgi:hypothetical protein
MLGPTDITRLASMIDPETAERNGLIEVGPPQEVDINHLDYGYVRTCTDKQEIKQLLAFLKYRTTLS